MICQHTLGKKACANLLVAPRHKKLGKKQDDAVLQMRGMSRFQTVFSQHRYLTEAPLVHVLFQHLFLSESGMAQAQNVP